jgi:hypothetical protein
MPQPSAFAHAVTVPSVSITTARTGASSKANAMGMRAMRERAFAKRREQYLMIKSPPASGKSRALMFIALDKLNNHGFCVRLSSSCLNIRSAAVLPTSR